MQESTGANVIVSPDCDYPSGTGYRRLHRTVWIALCILFYIFRVPFLLDLIEQIRLAMTAPGDIASDVDGFLAGMPDIFAIIRRK